MENSPQLQRALVLHEQGRHDLAEKELRQHLAQTPDHGFAHALLAISLLEQQQPKEATQAARDAVAHAPDLAFTHYAMARVLADRNHDAEAVSAIEEAIRLEPTDADYHAQRAAIEFNRRNWQETLRAAEMGLQFAPEHTGCNNLRAMALVKLGRKSEAGATIESTLARDPGNASSHANQGWTLLEQGRRREALGHFRESLRLDPTNDWARAGLVEGIKAGNPIYAFMLRYFLWMQKLSDRARWAILLGGYFGSRFLGDLSRTNPDLAPFVTPLRVAYIAFALLSWLAHPVFNLMLFLHPLGRHALDDEERSQARRVGLCLGLALASLGAWLLDGRNADYLIPAVVFGMLAIPTAAIHACSEGWPRTAMVAITLVLAAAGLLAVAASSFLQPPKNSPSDSLGSGAFGFFLLGTFISQFVANWLMTQRPRR
jgi:tetratricopeptide (TPR) repeat protein